MSRTVLKRPPHAVALAFGLFVAGCQSLETAEQLYASGDYQSARAVYERHRIAEFGYFGNDGPREC